MDNEFMQHPKVIMARKLLREAESEIIVRKKSYVNNMKCQCGHKYSDHGPSHSINYTAGVCHKCDCLNFVIENKFHKLF